MVSFFKDKSAVSVFWLIIVCCGLHFYALVNPPGMNDEVNDGLFFYLLQPFNNLQPYTVSIIYVLIIFLLSLQINFIVNDLRLLAKQSYTPALAFVLLSALLPAFNKVSPELLSCNLFIWIIYSTCKLYNNSNAKTAIYNVGLITSASVILYYPMLPLVLIIMIAFFIIRPFKPNEFFVLMFGILTPVYFFISYLFLKNNLQQLPAPTAVFNVALSVTRLTIPAGIALIAAALVTVWAMFIVQQTGSRELIQVRKSWTLISLFLVLFLPAIFFIQHAWPSAILVAMVPASCYIGYALSSTSRSIVPAIIFWLLAGLSIYNNWFAKVLTNKQGYII